MYNPAQNKLSRPSDGLPTFAAPNHNQNFGTKMKNLKTGFFNVSTLQESFWHDRPIFGNIFGSAARSDTVRARAAHVMNTVEHFPYAIG